MITSSYHHVITELLYNAAALGMCDHVINTLLVVFILQIVISQVTGSYSDNEDIKHSMTTIYCATIIVLHVVPASSACQSAVYYYYNSSYYIGQYVVVPTSYMYSVG